MTSLKLSIALSRNDNRQITENCVHKKKLGQTNPVTQLCPNAVLLWATEKVTGARVNPSVTLAQSWHEWVT